jgi:hypothetical protein
MTIGIVDDTQRTAARVVAFSTLDDARDEES